MSLLGEIRNPHSKVFRRCLIKRRESDTGLFESAWLDISDDVKKWGSYKVAIDSQYPNRFSFSNATLVFANDEGRYNPETEEPSLWYGYLSQQRTLVRIEAGFVSETLSASGIWDRDEVPNETQWDVDDWDEDSSEWDTDGALFTGIISGDISLSNKNEVSFTVKPLTQVFLDYAARNLTGWTSTGMTASQFITMLRDQTDSLGNYVFRPFFGNTTTGWDISTTSNVFTTLNTSTAVGIIDSNVWDVIQKLAEAENFVPYVTRNGTFKFVSREENSDQIAFQFHGSGSFDTTYGTTIKSIDRFGKRLTKYYSRVEVKWREEDTSTSYEVAQSALEVSPQNNPWNLGERTLKVENIYIPTATVAATIALDLFNEYSSLKNEILFSTSFIPTLEILDRVSISYDSPATSRNTLWDQNDWAADTTSTSTDLFWELPTGDAISLLDAEFKFLSIDVNLDRLETKFEAREI